MVDGANGSQSFLIVTSLFTAVLPPLLILLLQPLTSSLINYLPAGPTALIFALLAQYHAIIPHTYRYHVATTSSPSSQSANSAADSPSTLTLSDKSPRYLLALQLALFQLPASLITAPLGFLLGYSFRSGILPLRLTRWRVPGWLVGAETQKRSAEFEGLRRRLEGEDGGAGATTTGREGGEGGSMGRRGPGREMLNRFM